MCVVLLHLASAFSNNHYSLKFRHKMQILSLFFSTFLLRLIFHQTFTSGPDTAVGPAPFPVWICSLFCVCDITSCLTECAVCLFFFACLNFSFSLSLSVCARSLESTVYEIEWWHFSQCRLNVNCTCYLHDCTFSVRFHRFIPQDEWRRYSAFWWSLKH